MAALLNDIENYVIDLLNTNLNSNFIYHNLPHTQRVVDKTTQLIENSDVSAEDAENLLIAAWFHDTGFIVKAENHEAESVKIATKYLIKKGFDNQQIEAISNLILATKIGHKPINKLQKIIIDADCAHLASKNFFEYTSLLRKEWELTGVKSISDIEWFTVNIHFFTLEHKFHTEFALKNWTKTKDKNLSKLIKSLKELEQEKKKFKQKQEVLEIKKEKNIVPERGIETMFRVALKNHMTLSNIADTKANILLSVNAIIVSLALSNLLPKLDNSSNSYLIYPTIIFIAFTVASIVLSILATRPNVTEGKFSKDDVAKKKVNLLFFGNFHQMELEDFQWGISEMMKDKDYLYNSLTKDLYFLGLVLNRKYKILRITYTVFMIGILVSVLAFAISFKIEETGHLF